MHAHCAVVNQLGAWKPAIERSSGAARQQRNEPGNDAGGPQHSWVLALCVALFIAHPSRARDVVPQPPLDPGPFHSEGPFRADAQAKKPAKAEPPDADDAEQGEPAESAKARSGSEPKRETPEREVGVAGRWFDADAFRRVLFQTPVVALELESFEAIAGRTDRTHYDPWGWHEQIELQVERALRKRTDVSNLRCRGDAHRSLAVLAEQVREIERDLPMQRRLLELVAQGTQIREQLIAELWPLLPASADRNYRLLVTRTIESIADLDAPLADELEECLKTWARAKSWRDTTH